MTFERPALVSSLISLFVAVASCPAIGAPIKVLFVGNSFTYGHAAPTSTYNADSITDANGLKYGGVPAIFKQFTEQAGLDYDVTIEAVGGKPLSFHLTKPEIIGAPGWDAVVLQGHSTESLPAAHGGNPGRFIADAVALRDMVRSKNNNAAVYLYETWSSPKALPAQRYTTDDAGLRAMQDDLKSAAFAAFAKQRFEAVVRVGDAFMLALDLGIATHISLDGSATSSKGDAVDLWDPEDARHASKYGYYLSAALMYAKITKQDPRSLQADPGSAAAALGITDTQARSLHALAYVVDALPDPKPAADVSPATAPAPANR